MTVRNPCSWQPGDAQFVAGLAAYLVFAVSGGVYAGTEGRTQAVALAVGILAPVLFVCSLVWHIRAGAGSRRVS